RRRDLERQQRRRLLSRTPQRAVLVMSPPVEQQVRVQIVAPRHYRYRLPARQCLLDHLALERQRIASSPFLPCRVHFAPPWTPSACPSKPKRVSLIAMDTSR